MNYIIIKVSSRLTLKKSLLTVARYCLKTVYSVKQHPYHGALLLIFTPQTLKNALFVPTLPGYPPVLMTSVQHMADRCEHGSWLDGYKQSICESQQLAARYGGFFSTQDGPVVASEMV